MRPNLEIEKKLELSQDGYRRLLQQATVESKVEQLNVYFDEDWVLAENAATVRVRFASGQPPMLTFKVPLSNSNGIRTAHEYEFRIEREFARRCRVTRRAIEVGDGWPTEVREAA